MDNTTEALMRYGIGPLDRLPLPFSTSTLISMDELPIQTLWESSTMRYTDKPWIQESEFVFSANDSITLYPVAERVIFERVPGTSLQRL